MRYSVILLIISFVFNLSAQEGDVVGETHKIYSESLDQQIDVQIHLPQDYEEGGKDYPTLYILDGQWYFMNGVAINESLRGDRILPKFIVIGVNMVDRPYRSKMFNQWDSFITFIESELVPYVNKSFRTSSERIIFGWENSGYLTSELILRKDSPFNYAIASNGAYIDEDTLESLNTEEERFLFIAGSKKDIYSIDASDQAAQTLSSIDAAGLNWKYQLFNEEEHESLAYISIYQGLKFFYHNYGPLVFSSLDEFRNKGGIPFLNQYFKERGERFNVSIEIDNSTKNSLIWLSWKRDKFEAFDLFMTEFEDVLSTRRYANAYWQNRLAQYYLKYRSYDKAITFFERGIEQYSDEKYMVAMYIGLGSAYHGKGNKKLTKKYLQKGVELAQVNNDPKLKEYQELLRQIVN
ncbi:alpha/beta hydrolase-fold protein [Ekhidna sp.]